MTSGGRSPARIARSVEQLRQQFGMGSPTSLDLIAERCAFVVGAEVAPRVEVVDLRDGIVRIEVAEPGIAEVIGWSTPRLIEEFRAACPDETIRDLTVRVRRVRPR